jgi:hypothetical protein
MKNIDNAELVTVTGGVTTRPDGGTCTDPIRRPTSPLDPRPAPFPTPTDNILGGARAGTW